MEGAGERHADRGWGARRVQLDGEGNAHLADFGLATYARDVSQHSAANWKGVGKPTGGFQKKNMVGTLPYMPPEVLQREVHTHKADVFSFAITIK